MAFQDRVLRGVELTRENFRIPPLEMGIVPFWFWNGDMEPGEMEWQLRQYHDRGVRSLFIHPRMGLRVPYLSETWFERIRFAVAKAREIGIDAWIYDENDWPSGTADYQVMESDPELGQRYLELVALHLDGPIFTFLEAHDDRYVNTGDSRPVAAYAVRRDEYEQGIRNLVDLGKNLAWEKTIAWEAPAGKWMLLYFLEKRAPFYIDTLNPESTKKFIELTHERYKEAVGDEFGRTVPGFFTDEPAMYYYHVGLFNYVIPWSKQMFKIFRERRGYDLKPYLPALYVEMEGLTAQVRYDFWRTLTEQYAETYYGQLRDWCEKHGLIFTGHLLFEEYLRMTARCEGNIFRYLEKMHMTGVDHLYPKVGSAREPDQHVALKVGSSAAHHFGSDRLLCESMGGTYWDCTLARMKWINNWEYVLGVNLFNNHGYHYTIEGERKRDWPPSQFYHHTWWKYYDRFVQYNARLSHVLSGGRHVAKVLVLYPINSIWTNYTPHKTNRVVETIERDFHYLTDTLLRLHYDFDYVDEDVLAGATVVDGTLRIADEQYSIFILPPVTHIKASTYRILQDFVESGGNLITGALLPEGLLEGEGKVQITEVDDFFGVDPKAHRRAFDDPKATFEVEHRKAGGNVFHLKNTALYARRIRADLLIEEGGRTGEQLKAFIREERGENASITVDQFLEEEATWDRIRREALRQALNESAPPDVTISEDDVFYLHRVKDAFDVYFLANITQEDKGRVTITFEQVARPELWDPNTGETEPINVYRVRDGRLEIELDFPPNEAHVVVLKGDADVPHVTDTNLCVEQVSTDAVVGFSGAAVKEVFARVATGGDEVEVRGESKSPRHPIRLPDRYRFEPEQDNVLVIGRWKMSLEDAVDDAAACMQPGYDDSAWLDVEQGAWEPQLPHERDDEVYPVALWYRTHFEIADLPSDVRLMIDGFAGSSYRLFVNGSEVEDKGVRSWLDAEIKEVNVLPFVRQGRNTVAVRLEVTRRTDGLLDLLKIVGDFSVYGSETSGFRIAARNTDVIVGSWTNQGYPFYSGTGVYRTELDVPAEYLDGGRLYLEADCGEDVLEVRVNDGEPRVAVWYPYRLDVTDDLHQGLNTIEIRVTNTLINILEGVQKASGLFAPPRIVHEHRYELVRKPEGAGHA